MPGSANSVFTPKSATDARLIAEELHNMVAESSDGYMAVRKWAINRMSAIGADFYLHTFTHREKPFTSMRFFSSPQQMPRNWNSTRDGDLGVNTVGIIKAPRAEGNEAVVLVTPFTLDGGKLSSADKLTLSFGMALFELYGSANWLARDVIWVLADARCDSHTAVAAWLEEYHEPKLHFLSAAELAHLYGQITDGMGDASVLEFKRAGFISAGLVFQVSAGNRGQVDSIKVSAEGPNGQMPNLDLINIINTLAQWRRLNIHLDDIIGVRESALLRGLGGVIENIGYIAGKVHGDWGFVMSASSYVESFATLCASFLNQAIGRSTGAHGAFRDYQIDAVTLNMFAGGDLESSSYQIDLFTRYGRLVEGVMRSVNNLLEKFHQSFFLYLLCSPSKFVSVGLYMIPLGLLLITLPLGAAALNSALNKADEIGPTSDSQVLNPHSTNASIPKSTTTKVVGESKENAGRWRRAILVVSVVQLLAFVIALLPPIVSSFVDILETSLASSTTSTPVGGFTSASLRMLLWAVVALVSPFVALSFLPSAEPGDWMAVKALVLGISTIGLVVMSQVDFAVSLIGAVVLVPTCLCTSPMRDIWGSSTKAQQKEQSFLGRISLFLGIIVTILGSPPVLLAAVAAFLLDNSHWIVSFERLWEWTELLWSGGSALYIFIMIVYLPSSYLSIYILFS